MVPTSAIGHDGKPIQQTLVVLLTTTTLSHSNSSTYSNAQNVRECHTPTAELCADASVAIFPRWIKIACKRELRKHCRCGHFYKFEDSFGDNESSSAATRMKYLLFLFGGFNKRKNPHILRSWPIWFTPSQHPALLLREASPMQNIQDRRTCLKPRTITDYHLTEEQSPEKDK
jgi:hypothetical protein